MAVNKRKILEAARKHAQKGAKEKALKEYHVLLKLDPRDAKLHLEIGDCYRRWGQIDEAVAQYGRVADQYKNDGFDARAVAVFKQILNLDPKRYAAYVSLAELYQRMGLDSEALGALQTAADGYHKEGDKPAALELLRKMATLDPTNTTSRLKVAELLRQEGMEDEAVSEYQEVVAELGRQGASEQTLPVLERILELQPDRADILLDLARKLIEVRKPERAEPIARRAADCDPENTEALELLCDLNKTLGNDEALQECTRKLAKIYRDRGDEDKARELTQRIPMGMELTADEDEEGDSLVGDSSQVDELSEELPLEPDDEIELEFGVEGDSDELVLDDPEDSVEPDAPLPEGDPDQLLAEASVYLRYGKRDQAIASLQAVLQQEPEHRATLERLGEAYAEGGDDVPAVSFWTRAAKRAAADADSEGFEVLRDRIAALDADAAAALQAPGGESLVEPEIEDDLGDAEDDFEIDVSIGDEIDEEEDAEDLGADASDAEIDIDDEFEIDVDVDDEPDLELDSEPGAQVSETESSTDDSSTLSQQAAEQLEEAEFYYSQELFDEAEAIYRRVLKIAPNHPSALLRLGELAAAKAEGPTAKPDEPVAEETASADADIEFELDIDDLEDEEEEEVRPARPFDDSTEVAELSADDVDEPAIEIDVPPRVDESDGDAEEGGDFDLAAELRDVIEEDEDASQRDTPLSTVEDGLASIFADFKQGVSATLSDDDYETRYDLGIAYREMELYDDAIGEFRTCLASPSRKLSSLHMMGLCALDLGRADDAANHLGQALATGDLQNEQIAGLQFDLGRALEVAGDLERALSAYQAAAEANPDLPGVSERIEALESGEDGDALELSENDESEDFESFDDIFTEVEDEDDSEPSESFESFDDVITAVEAEEPVVEAEPEPADKPKKKKKGKKKISFV